MLTALNKIDERIDIRKLFRALLVLTPTIIIAAKTGDSEWMHTAIITYACFNAAQRLDLTPFGVLILGILVLIAFIIFYFSLLVPALFIAICAITAMTTVGLAAFGENLRWAGVSVFISALYIACETAEEISPNTVKMHGLQELPYIVFALTPVLCLSIFDNKGRFSSMGGGYKGNILSRLCRKDPGEPTIYGEAIIATGISVSVAATLVEWEGFNNGQWIIWSTASVLVTGAPEVAHIKLLNRAVGALAGGAIGIGIGYLLPHTSVTYGVTIVIGLISFLACRRYIVGYGIMSAAVACAIIVANLSPEIAADRSINVVLGGAIGVIFLFLVHWLNGAIKFR